jgi:hypothetical protein
MEKGSVAFAGGRDYLLVSKCRENFAETRKDIAC